MSRFTMDGQSEKTIFNKWHNGEESDHGSFFTALFEAYVKASENNRSKIRKAFPEYFIEAR